MKGYELKVKEITDKKEEKQIIGKIGGKPTYLPDDYEDIVDYFVMELYNTEAIKGKEDGLDGSFIRIRNLVALLQKS